jgi:hypothetical protein
MCHPCRSTLTRPLAPAARPPFRPHHHINGEAPKRNLLDSAQQAPRTMSRSHFHLTSCGVNLFIVVAPCGPILQKRGGGGGMHVKIHRGLTLTPTLPLIRSLSYSNGGKPPHHAVHAAAAPESSICTGSRPSSPTSSQTP